MTNEEQTKQSLVLPFFMGLGYNVFNPTEFIPEYVADFGTKQGEKVDYAIISNGQPVAIIEVKKLGTTLGEQHLSQLFRYFASTDSKLAILTNGDDYWFFTDSIKANTLDIEPYMKIKISNITDEDKEALSKYAKENIDGIDISSDVKDIRFKTISQGVIRSLLAGDIQKDFIDLCKEKSGIVDIEYSKAAKIIAQLISSEVLAKYSSDQQVKRGRGRPPIKELLRREEAKPIASDRNKDSETKDNKSKDTDSKDRDNKDFDFDREYVYNDKTYGGWAFKKLEYILFNNNKIYIRKAKDILIEVVKTLVKNEYITVEDLENPEYFKALKVGKEKPDYRQMEWIPEIERWMFVGFGIDIIISQVERVLAFSSLPDEILMIKFTNKY